MKGSFNASDVAYIRKYSRKDSFWSYIKRQIKISSVLMDKKVRVCEIGAGSGDISVLSDYYLKDCVKEYVCTDSSKEMLKMINDKGIVKKIFIDADNEDIPSADIYLMKFSFHHIRNKQRLLEMMYDKLPEKGSIIFIDKVPVFQPFGKMIEFFLHVLNIKPILGKHFHIPLKKIFKMAEKKGFIIEDRMIKKPSRLKNFFVYKVFMVLRKNYS
ncbi:MAG: class I SAM-dependent methyltransferase [Nanobdellota archaeon]